MEPDGCKEGKEISALLGIGRIFPVDLRIDQTETEERGREYLLSMPLKPETSTKAFADRPK